MVGERIKEIEYEFFAVGKNKNINWQEWYRFNIELYRNLNLNITHIGYQHSEREDGKYRSFSRMKKKIETDLQKDLQFNSIEFASTPKDWTIICQDAVVRTSLYIRFDNRVALSICCKNESHLLDNLDDVIGLSKKFLHVKRSEFIQYSGSFGINYWSKDEIKPGYIESVFEYFEVVKKIK